jgi:hypothetical protein
MSEDSGPLFVYEETDGIRNLPRNLVTGESCQPFADIRRQYVKQYHIIQISKQQLMLTYDAHKVNLI